MKQLGNLAIICAKRPEMLMQIYNGTVCVHVGEGPNREHLQAAWDDDAAINKMIHEINHGKYAEKERMNTNGTERKCA